MPEKKSSLSTALQTRKKKTHDDTFTLNGWLIFKNIKY